MWSLGMQGCNSGQETLPGQNWRAKGLEELRGLLAAGIPDGSGISGASSMCSKGCLERTFKVGAFPGTHEPSREEYKENLSSDKKTSITVPHPWCHQVSVSFMSCTVN